MKTKIIAALLAAAVVAPLASAQGAEDKIKGLSRNI